MVILGRRSDKKCSLSPSAGAAKDDSEFLFDRSRYFPLDAPTTSRYSIWMHESETRVSYHAGNEGPSLNPALRNTRLEVQCIHTGEQTRAAVHGRVCARALREGIHDAETFAGSSCNCSTRYRLRRSPIGFPCKIAAPLRRRRGAPRRPMHASPSSWQVVTGVHTGCSVRLS